MFTSTRQIDWRWEYDSCWNSRIKTFFYVSRIDDGLTEWIDFGRRISINHWSQLNHEWYHGIFGSKEYFYFRYKRSRIIYDPERLC